MLGGLISIAPRAGAITNGTPAPDAPLEFAGTFFGYSSGSREAASLSVTRAQGGLTGDVYRHAFEADAHLSLIPGAFGAALEALRNDVITNHTTHLIEPGDSGGPLFDGTKLCGINSAYGTNFGCFRAQFCVPAVGCFEVPCDPITGL